MKILMTGATGLIGKQLGKKLSQEGHEIIVISRQRKKAELELPFQCQVIEADISKAPLKEKINVDVVFHLLGESVSQRRWNDEVKKDILDSRVESTKNLGASLQLGVKHFISASAIGVYGDRPKESLSEKSQGDKSFLSEVCESWEKAVSSIASSIPEVKISIVRIGIVLADQGGALAQMLRPFKAGVGGSLGSGNQFMSWIHIEDLVSLFTFIMNQKLTGVFNGVSPAPVMNKTFSRELANTLRRPLGLPIPAFMLKILFGEMSRVILSDQKVYPERVIQSGFSYKFTSLREALEDLLKNQKKSEECFVVEQFIPQPRSKVFDFFCEAKNLEEITPSHLNFKILKSSTENIQKGTLIDYRLKIRGIPVYWKTLIEDWSPIERFIDTQIEGPYSLWHHTHEFFDVPGGTLMRDTVRYKVPLDYVGWISSIFLVSKEVGAIFDYRKKVVYQKFYNRNS
ncbi:MAG: TIGR01777 family oxidoreductase [Bdellovibrionaceae bacterium]|nr:TIGR01777 family oxidoreductase [Pseudobdellovibrionaceae bacterium]NUM58430.1 TIGR01777 family protein [Pseudobdellovibrionaceae bacterium]